MANVLWALRLAVFLIWGCLNFYFGWIGKARFADKEKYALVEKQLATLNEARQDAAAESEKRRQLIDQAAEQAASSQDEIERLADENTVLINRIAIAERVRTPDRVCPRQKRVPVRAKSTSGDDAAIAGNRALFEEAQRAATEADRILEIARLGQQYANAVGVKP